LLNSSSSTRESHSPHRPLPLLQHSLQQQLPQERVHIIMRKLQHTAEHRLPHTVGRSSQLRAVGGSALRGAAAQALAGSSHR
jgi:hypothetical protein